MALVPAKCPNCGGLINIDPETRAGICEFCKQAFVSEDAINNYNTQYISNTYIDHADVQVDVGNVNKKIESAETFMTSLKDYNKAESIYTEILASDPGNYKAHLGMARAATNDLNPNSIDKHAYKGKYTKVSGDIQKAIAFAPLEEKESIRSSFRSYLSGAKASYESYKNNLHAKAADQRNKVAEKKAILQNVKDASAKMRPIQNKINKAHDDIARNVGATQYDKQHVGCLGGILLAIGGFSLFVLFFGLFIDSNGFAPGEMFLYLLMAAGCGGGFFLLRHLKASYRNSGNAKSENDIAGFKKEILEIQNYMDRISGISGCDIYKMEQAVQHSEQQVKDTMADISRIESVINEIGNLLANQL